MLPKFLKDYVIYEDESLFKGNWQLNKNKCILVVVNREENCVGVATMGEMDKSYFHDVDETITIGHICNRNYIYCSYDEDDNKLYSNAREIFFRYENIEYLPIIDSTSNLVDIMSRKRAFYNQYYKNNKLWYMDYATCIYSAAREAVKLKYDGISVIEFGVAGGNGLVACEFHAREISKLLGIKIEVYGFDREHGLPAENEGSKDLVHVWMEGDYPMNKNKLLDRLQFAKLVLGDIKQTTNTFFTDYTPSPVGVFLVDVDYYSSTVPILKMLNEEYKWFLPRIQMYFDDISDKFENSGETLAIKEFNLSNKTIKISPESPTRKIKLCSMMNHPKYNISLAKNRVLDRLPLHHNTMI